MVLLGLMQLPLFGQATSTRKVDYGQAVGELIKLGFPDTRGAKYVNLKDQSLRYAQGGFSSVGSDERPVLTGNGFYLASKDTTKPDMFITLSGVVYDYVKKREDARSRRGASYESRIVSGEMKGADLKKDIQTIKKWAIKQTLDSSFSYNGTRYFSVVFGFANLAYQAGMKDEANDLLKIVFLNHDAPDKIIDQLISQLATQDYTTWINCCA
jgi:hypothetical protein